MSGKKLRVDVRDNKGACYDHITHKIYGTKTKSAIAAVRRGNVCRLGKLPHKRVSRLYKVFK